MSLFPMIWRIEEEDRENTRSRGTIKGVPVYITIDTIFARRPEKSLIVGYVEACKEKEEEEEGDETQETGEIFEEEDDDENEQYFQNKYKEYTEDKEEEDEEESCKPEELMFNANLKNINRGVIGFIVKTEEISWEQDIYNFLKNHLPSAQMVFLLQAVITGSNNQILDKHPGNIISEIPKEVAEQIMNTVDLML